MTASTNAGLNERVERAVKWLL